VLKPPKPNQTKSGGGQFPAASTNPKHNSMILFAKKPVTCCECGKTYTPQQMYDGEIRMHQIKKGIMCSDCFEDFKGAPLEEYEPWSAPKSESSVSFASRITATATQPTIES
jgi:hypothetical protein